eukprot:825720-Amphidinium_carterae.1
MPMRLCNKLQVIYFRNMTTNSTEAVELSNSGLSPRLGPPLFKELLVWSSSAGWSTLGTVQLLSEVYTFPELRWLHSKWTPQELEALDSNWSEDLEPKVPKEAVLTTSGRWEVRWGNFCFTKDQENT